MKCEKRVEVILKRLLLGKTEKKSKLGKMWNYLLPVAVGFKVVRDLNSKLLES